MAGCIAPEALDRDNAITETPHAVGERTLDQSGTVEDSIWANFMFAYPDALRPEVDLVRYVSPNEAAAIRAQCLNEEGFPDARATSGGQLQSGVVPPSQDEAFWIASFVCAVRYQIDPQFTQPLNASQLSALHSYYVEDLTSCLVAEGYIIEQAPSIAVFTESYFENPWNPYLSVPEVNQSEWERLDAVCPQWPSGFYGY